MKQLCNIIPILIIVIASGVSNAAAQNDISFGVKGAINFADVSLSGVASTVESSSLTTFGFGGIVEYGLSPSIFLEAELLYIQKGARTNTIDPNSGTISSNGKFNYLEFPILVNVKFNATALKPYIFAGPAIGFLLSANSETEFRGLHTTADVKDKTESTEFSIILGAGVAYGITPLTSLTGDISYSLGLSNIAKPLNPNDKTIWKSRDLNVNIGILVTL